MAAWPVLCGRQACHCPSQSSLEQYPLTGTRRDTGHPTISLMFWPRSEQSHLQEDKKCATGDRGAWARQGAATQARGWPLPYSAPLSRVAVGLSASSLSTTAGNQCASDQPKSMPMTLVHSFRQLRGEAKAQGRGENMVWGRHSPQITSRTREVGGPIWAQSEWSSWGSQARCLAVSSAPASVSLLA